MASRAFRLIVEACRLSFAGGDGNSLRSLSAGVDWSALLGLVRRHRVEALTWQALTDAGVALPPAIATALAAEAAATVHQSLANANACAELGRRFEAAGEPVLFIKGVTLGALAYRQPFLKMGWDIDILVARERLIDAMSILRGAGFAAASPATDRPEELADWHRRWKESVWARPDGLHVELHSALADSAALIPGITVHSPTQQVRVAPGILLPTLAVEELFAYLCVHGASSAWFRLKWITDLAALVQRQAGGDAAALYHRSQELGAGRTAAQALLLGDALYDLLGDSPLRAELRRSARNRALAALADSQLRALREPTLRPLGTLGIHANQILVVPGLGGKSAELRRLLSRAGV